MRRRVKDAMEANETDLVRSAMDGDAHAFGELIQIYDTRTLQIAFGITGNMADAEDAWQDGVVKAYTQLSSFRMESRFGTWLTRIVINQALNIKRRRKVHVADEGDAVFETLPSYDASPEDILETQHLSDHIVDSMEALSARERAVFVLKHMHGFKLREIAVMLDCAEGTVKNYLFRAVRKMRTSLS